MITLNDLQHELIAWQRHNFPTRTFEEPFKGMVEELGELSHGLLKQKQGIRGTYEEHEAKIKDSVGDLVVFLADFCNARGYNLTQIIDEVWSEVKKRDWMKNKMNADKVVTNQTAQEKKDKECCNLTQIIDEVFPCKAKEQQKP